jgi:glucose/arabinose dehydrogenase
MKKKIIVTLSAILPLLAGGILYAPSGLANPAWDPFDDTRFAPIEDMGESIGLETVATGLAAPLKGVAAPGLPDHLFVIDQPGQIYAIDLTAPRPVECPGPDCPLFFDVDANLPGLGLVDLGCVPEQNDEFGGSFDERGLLGLAFHQDFASNGKFYTYTSEKNDGAPTFTTTLSGGPGTGDHQNVIREWDDSTPGDTTDPGNVSHSKELMRVDWPQFNHDGGDLAIRASDGTLFISMGDGGGADDRDEQFFIDCGSDPTTASAMVGHGLDGNGQKLTNPLGKILRIDVDGSNSGNGQYGIPGNNPFVGAGGGVVEEIFALGFRNPYRFSFDKEDPRHLYVGNVGQNDLEETELVRSGANHGWPIKEGTLFFAHNGNDDGEATPDDPGTATAPQPLAPDLVGPVSQYDTHHEGHAIIAGFIYRGEEVPELRSRFVFGDFSLIFRFPIGPQDYGRLFVQNRRTNPGSGLREIEELRVVPGNALSLALLGWGEDAAGELYPMGNISGLPFFTEGRVLKIVPAPEPEDVD